MTDGTMTGSGTAARRDWARGISRVALVLAIGSVMVALAAGLGSGRGWWPFRTGFTLLEGAFFAAIAGVLLGLAGLFLGRRRMSLVLANLAALVVALGFVLFLGNLVRTAKSVPAIHDVTTNLADVPQFTRLTLRADNLEKIPDEDSAQLKALPAEARWKAVHRLHYGDLHTLRLPLAPAAAVRRAATLAREKGWDVALLDPAAGRLEATATSRFFRFKDDVVILARPAPGGGSLVDMRSVSRVGQSDLGVNAARVRDFLRALQQG